MAYKGYKYRLYPNKQQEEKLANTFRATRFLYNAMLEDKIKYYEKTGKTINKLADPYIEANPWLKQVDLRALYKVKYNLDDAWKVFLANKDNGYPRFKSKLFQERRYRTDDRALLRVTRTHVFLPKIGQVKVKLHRLFPRGARLIEAGVSQTPSGKYFVSILFQYAHPFRRVQAEKFLGLDFATRELYVDSEGRSADYPEFYHQSLQKLRREQRKLDKMQHRSKNWEKQRVKVAKVHEKVHNQRVDFLNKLSLQLAEAYDCICVEDLNLREIRDKRRKSLRRSLVDSSYGIFIDMLRYKLEDRGKELVKIDRYFPSSQLCHRCGYQNKGLKDYTVKTWVCPGCQTEHDRDHNAAINIRNEGRRLAVKRT